MEKKTMRMKCIERLLGPLLAVMLILMMVLLPMDVIRNTAYATENDVTLNASLIVLDNSVTDKVKLTISIDNSQGKELSGVQMNVLYPSQFTLISKEKGNFFENGVSNFGQTGANPMFCGLGCSDNASQQEEYVTTQSGTLLTLVFEANTPLQSGEAYRFGILQDGKLMAFCQKGDGTEKPPVTTYYGVNIGSYCDYTPAASGGSITGSEETPQVNPEVDENGDAAVKKQVISESLKQSKNVLINMTTSGTSTEATNSLEVAKDSLEEIANKRGTLAMNTDGGEIKFGTTALNSIQSLTTGDNLVISVEKKDKFEVGGGEPDIQNAVVFEVTAKLVNADNNAEQEITQFGGGEVEIRLNLPASLLDKELICWYAEGNTHSVVSGEKVGGQYVFTTTHFSKYYVAEESTLNEIAQKTESNSGVTVNGQVKSYNGKNNFTVTLYHAGTSTASKSVTVTGNGQSGQSTQNFSIEEVESGTYDLVVTKAGHLKYTITGVVVGSEDLDLTANSNASIKTITMLAGDVNGDDWINSTDLGIVLQGQNYGKQTSVSGTNQNADINGDEWINSTDLGIILQGQHYGKAVVTVMYSE